MIFSDSSSTQSWRASFSSAWTTSIRSAWRIPTRCWSRAPRCSTCGPPARARGPRVSITSRGVAVNFSHLLVTLYTPASASLTQSQSDYRCNGIAVCPGNPSPSSLFSPSACVSPSRVFTAVESLYAALKSIDRMDIVNMLEGQPPQPARQGSRDLSRRRHNEREHLSPGMTNGKFPPQIPQCSPFPVSPSP